MDIHGVQQALVKAMGSQIFAGGSALALVGGLMAWGRNLPVRLWAFLLGRFTVSLEIESTDASFTWLCAWLDEHPYAKRARRLAVATLRRAGQRYDEDGNPIAPRLLFTPAPGEHLLWFKRRLMYLERKRSPPAETGGYSRAIRESMHIRIPARSQAILRDLIEEARILFESDNVRPRVLVSNMDDWVGAGEVPQRSWESVILPEGMSQKILHDTKTFLSEEAWYLHRGIPYRRGFLFYGPPGTGKSSTVSVMANKFKMSLYVLNVGAKKMDDETLQSLMQSVPARSFILMEDVDAAVATREDGDTGSESNGVTLSGLLNAIDGVASSTGCITVLTTNHLDRLDPALIRRGRVDERYEFTYASPWQAEEMYKLFYGTDDGAKEFGDGVRGRDVSPADLQHILIINKDSPDTAIGELHLGIVHAA